MRASKKNYVKIIKRIDWPLAVLSAGYEVTGPAILGNE
jgi:hypothetical protein